MNTESLTLEEKRRYMSHAIIATSFGSVMQIALSESSLFLLYASSLGAGKFLSLVTTSFIHVMNLFLLIPVAYAMERYGIRKILIPCYVIGMLAMIAASAAGFLNQWALAVFSAGITVYAVSITVHSAGWFPILRFIVPEDGRGAFFGRIRYIWQGIVTVFLLLSAIFVGRDASVLRLQLIIAVGALLIIGRVVFVSKIPERALRRRIAPFRVMFFSTLKNRKLVRYSIYMFAMKFFIASSVPLGFAFLKYEAGATDQMMVLFSAFSNTAMIIGFIIAARTIDSLPVGRLLVPVRYGFLLVSAMFVIFSSARSGTIVSAVILISLAAGLYAFLTVILSAKMMGLVKENNVNISIAFCVGITSGGVGLSRFFSSVMIDRLPGVISLWGLNATVYQALFAFYGLGLLVLSAAHGVISARRMRLGICSQER